MSMSLRKRMTLLALLPAALVAGLLTALSLWHDIDNLEQGFRTRGNALSRQMATAAEYGIFSGQHANLLALTASTLTIDGSVRGAAIVDVGFGVVVPGQLVDIDDVERAALECEAGRHPQSLDDGVGRRLAAALGDSLDVAEA